MDRRGHPVTEPSVAVCQIKLGYPEICKTKLENMNYTSNCFVIVWHKPVKLFTWAKETEIRHIHILRNISKLNNMQSRTNKKNSMSAGYKFRIKSLSSPSSSSTHERFPIKKKKKKSHVHNKTHFYRFIIFFKKEPWDRNGNLMKKSGTNEPKNISIRYKSLRILL